MNTALLAAAIVISHAWIATPPTGAPTAAGYAVVRNEGKAPEVFLTATTPVAEKLELHRMSMTGGVMRMRPVTVGVSIAPGQALTLAPGSDYHLMVVRPKRPLKPGDRIPATLTFSKAGRLKTVFVVEAMAATAPMH